MKKLRVGIIGCGRISVVYKDAFKKLSEYIEVIGAMDKVLERAEGFAGFFNGCKGTDNIEELLEMKLDVVHIATPHYLHKEQGIRCMEAGVDVLTEKPIATTLEDAEAMIKASEKTGRKLGVIFQNRYIEGVVEAKKIIEAGELGEVKGAFSTLNWWRPPSYYECDWKGSWEKEGGGVLIDQAIHSVDMVRYLAGMEVKSIKGNIDNRVLTMIEVEDIANAAITFTNGAVYSLHACNYYQKNSPIEIEIIGEKGKVNIKETDVTINIDGAKPYTIYSSGDNGSLGKSYWGHHHYVQVKEFYVGLLEGREVNVCPVDASKTLELVLGVYESSRKNQRIFI